MQMNNIPRYLGIGHKVKTEKGKGKIIGIKGDIAKILVGDNVFEKNIKYTYHIKDKKSLSKKITGNSKTKIIDEYINNSSLLLENHLKKLDEIDANDYLKLFQWFFAVIVKGMNFVESKNFYGEHFWLYLAKSMETSLARKLNDDFFKIGSYAELDEKSYENPEIALKRILGQFLEQMVNADQNKDHGDKRFLQITLKIAQKYCTRFLEKFNIPYKKESILLSEISLN